MTGKIIKGIAGFYYVHAEDGLVYACRARGIFRSRGIKPLVGDDVVISVLGNDPPEGNVDEILPRRSELVRPAVANVDQALVVFAVKDPEPNLNLLDRFLVMLARLGVDAVIVMNKADLIGGNNGKGVVPVANKADQAGKDEAAVTMRADQAGKDAEGVTIRADLEDGNRNAAAVTNGVDQADEARDAILRLRGIYGPAGYPVLRLSTYTGEGLAEVRERLRGRTTVLAGPSGVGKSSLTNLLLPEARMETGTVSEKIRRGRHTTRHSELFCLGSGTYLLDTPGFSSMYMEEMEPEELKDCFPEFESYEAECRFPGCVHIGEKVCGVKAAVKAGGISSSRYENYRLLYTELKEKRRY